MNWFMSLEDARDKIERWRRDYNEFRPHSATFIPDTGCICPENGLRSRLNNDFFSFKLDYSLGDTSEQRFFLIQAGLLLGEIPQFSFSQL